jgi:hypothetical protein
VRLGPKRASARLLAVGGDGDSAADHIGQAAGAAVCVALEGGAGAAREQRGQQLGDGVGVPGVVQRVLSVADQRAHDGGGLLGLAGDRADQDVIQSGAAGAPAGQPQ